MNTGSTQSEEEKIVLPDFRSSEALKEEISLRVNHRVDGNWELVSLFSRGKYLYLRFEPHNPGQDAAESPVCTTPCYAG